MATRTVFDHAAPSTFPMSRAIRMGNPSVWIALALVGILTVVGVYDVLCVFDAVPYQTVSEVVSGWAKKYPAVAFAAGLLAGHLFW